MDKDIGFIEPRCKVCRSKNRAEYERLRLEEGFTYRKLAEVAKEKGDNLCDVDFWRHFKKHVEPIIKIKIDSDRVASIFAQKKIEERRALDDELNNNLKILNDVVQTALTRELDSRSMIALRSLLSEIRLTRDTIEKYRKSQVTTSEVDMDSLHTQLLDLIGDLDLTPEQLEKARALLSTGV